VEYLLQGGARDLVSDCKRWKEENEYAPSITMIRIEPGSTAERPALIAANQASGVKLFPVQAYTRDCQ
jgi:hypothetical protein